MTTPAFCAAHASTGTPRALPARCGRRAALAAGVAVLAATVALPPARADRTGRFSTRLTARRRYGPRVAFGARALRARAAGDTSAPSTAAVLDDLLPALRLLASGGVGEGAAAAPTRARLAAALDTINANAPAADTDNNALQRLIAALDDYADAAGITDIVAATS